MAEAHEPVRYVRTLVTRAKRDPQLAEELQKDPIGTLERVAGPAHDPAFYKIVVAGLAGIALIGTIGIILIALYDKKIPEALVAICSAAIGALGGVLTVASK